jgi:hypothetical protein
MEMTEERIEIQRVVCAACRYEGIIVVGIRHLDVLMRQTIKLMYPDIDPKSICVRFAREQGFVDQFGNFLTRTEALKIAIEKDQIYRTTNERELFSENLY